MHTACERNPRRWREGARHVLPVAALLCCAWLSGCAALTNPVVDGVPVHRLPPELLAVPKNHNQTIPLPLLEQPRPAAYVLGPGDILSVYVEGVLGDRTQPIPVTAQPTVQIRDQRAPTPTLGYPVPVREDGTIALPWVPPIRV